jgi:DNA-binding IclR family transcriptional regulator
MAAPEVAFLKPLEGPAVMPETEENQQVEQETVQPDAAPEAELGQADPWSDPEAARKEIEKLRRESAAYRTKNKELEPLARKAKELEDAQKSEQERLAEQLTREQERAAKAVRTAVAAKVEALAAPTFADPEDAAGALDLTAYVDADGVIDTDGIKRDLADLLNRKPHWARPSDNGPRRPAPDRTQGSSGNGNRTPSDPGDIFAGLMQKALKGH